MPASRISLANIVWHIEPEWRDALAGGQIETLLASDQPEPVKHGRFRSIFRTRIESIDVHIKQCRPVGLRAWLREWLRPAKALLEFRRMHTVAQRQVPTLQAIGWGRVRGQWPGASYLITRSLRDSVPLGEFLTTTLFARPEPLLSRTRQALARALGEFLAGLHRAAVLHRDLHPGNLLLQWDGERPRFVLLDLHDVVVRTNISPNDCLNNLIPFNRWFALRASRTDRLRFWRAYWTAMRERESAPASISYGRCREIETRTARSNRRFWRGRARRCVSTNRYFQKLTGPGVRGFAVRDLDAVSLADLLRDPDAPFRAGAQLLKDSRSSTVAEVDVTIDGKARRVICKRFRVTSRWDGPVGLLRPSACLRSWSNGHALRDGLLPTPRPLAIWHRHRAGMNWEGYLLVEKVDNAADLHQYLAALTGLPARRRQALLQACIDRLARSVCDLHERGCSHRDLKATNILVSHPDADTAGQVCFIDLAGVRRPRRLTDSRRQRDLARLNASFWSSPRLSRTDRLRFLRIYLQWNLKGRGDWKTWWRRIAFWTARKQARNLRRGRPLA